MMLKKNPRVLYAVLAAGVIATSAGLIAIGFGGAMFYTQRQMTDIVTQQQGAENRHQLELKNARLEERATCEARITISSGTSQQMRDDIQKQRDQIDSLIGSVKRLTSLSQQRATKGDQISQKVDNLTKKVDDATVIPPPQTVGVKRADTVNEEVKKTNRGLPK
jgi:hydroxypyruvate isomerase